MTPTDPMRSVRGIMRHPHHMGVELGTCGCAFEGPSHVFDAMIATVGPHSILLRNTLEGAVYEAGPEVSEFLVEFA